MAVLREETTRKIINALIAITQTTTPDENGDFQCVNNDLCFITSASIPLVKNIIRTLCANGVLSLNKQSARMQTFHINEDPRNVPSLAHFVSDIDIQSAARSLYLINPMRYSALPDTTVAEKQSVSTPNDDTVSDADLQSAVRSLYSLNPVSCSALPDAKAIDKKSASLALVDAINKECARQKVRHSSGATYGLGLIKHQYGTVQERIADAKLSGKYMTVRERALQKQKA